MSEIERGQFADTEKVVDADKQLAGEQIQRGRFQAYSDLAKSWVPNGRWLDIGCGSGFLLTLAQDAGYQAEGIDLNADRRAIAQQLTGATIHDKPVETLDFPADSFDVITMINVFSHLVSPSRTFKILQRILRPEGVLIIATAELGQGVKKSHALGWGLGDHLYFLGDGTLEKYAEQTGLTIVEHKKTRYVDAVYTRERFNVMGRSTFRNAVKKSFLAVPGAMPALRYVVSHLQANNAVYPSVYVLRRS